MQHWFTILNLSGWKVHFITLGLEFFNFFSLASGKIESFGILAVGLDINLKKPSFIEGGTMGFLALTLVWTCLKHSHSSPACFSLVQSLAKVNSIFLFLIFHVSPMYIFLLTCPLACLHHLRDPSCINSAYCCQHRLQNPLIFEMLFRGLGRMLQVKMAVVKLWASIQTFRSTTSLSWVWCLSPQGEQKSRSWIKFL